MVVKPRDSQTRMQSWKRITKQLTRAASATDLGSQRADGRVLITVDDTRHDAAAEHRVIRLRQQTDTTHAVDVHAC